MSRAKRWWSVVAVVVWSAMLTVPSGGATTDESQLWARVTVLAEVETGESFAWADTFLPGGVWSPAEAAAAGNEAVDREIRQHVAWLARRIDEVSAGVRLGPVRVRQVVIPLAQGEIVPLPPLGFDPELMIGLTLTSLSDQRIELAADVRDGSDPLGLGGRAGEPITLELRDTDIRDALKAFAALSQLEIVPDPDVEGRVTVELVDVPWDRAFDLLLRINGLGWERDGDVIRVRPEAALTGPRPVLYHADLSERREPGRALMMAVQRAPEAGRLVLLIEPLDEAPSSAARTFPSRLPVVRESLSDALIDQLGDATVVVRGQVDAAGAFEDIAVLGGVTGSVARALKVELEKWRFTPQRDATGRGVERVVGFGLLPPPTAMVSRWTGLTALVPPPDHLAVELEAGPAPGEPPGRYLVRAVIRDRDRNEILTDPQVVVASGKEAKLRSGFLLPDGREAVITLRVRLDGAAKTAEVEWQARRGDTVIASSRSVIQL